MTAVDDTKPEVFEIAPTCATGVHHCGGSRAEAEAVREDAVVARPGVSVARCGIEVHMDVDEARGDVEAREVNCSLGPVGGDVRRNGGNFTVGDGDVVGSVDSV